MALATFVDDYAKHSVFADLLDFVHFGRGGQFSLDFDAFAQTLHGGGGRAASHKRMVLFFNTETRVGQSESQVAIVREQQEAGGINVETANREDPGNSGLLASIGTPVGARRT